MRRVSLILTLFAWLLATGSHWDLVQTFAWGRMLAGYAESMPFTRAVAKTFSPETMCPICRAVATAQQQSAANPAVPTEKSPGKILLVCAPAAVLVGTPVFSPSRLLPAPAAPSSLGRAAPPSPPPRAPA